MRAPIDTDAERRRLTRVKRVEVTEDGAVECPKCGAQNQFARRRTGKARLMVAATGGVGALATSKKLQCMGCGKNLKTA
jgi:ssDNA-binding Zn-finger/Zn-ribbon topoisomerase 1